MAEDYNEPEQEGTYTPSEPTESLKVNREDLARNIRIWRTTAAGAGWKDEFDSADVTVWVDDKGKVIDSVATNTGGGNLYIVAEGTHTHLLNSRGECECGWDIKEN